MHLHVTGRGERRSGLTSPTLECVVYETCQCVGLERDARWFGLPNIPSPVCFFFTCVVSTLSYLTPRPRMFKTQRSNRKRKHDGPLPAPHDDPDPEDKDSAASPSLSSSMFRLTNVVSGHARNERKDEHDNAQGQGEQQQRCGRSLGRERGNCPALRSKAVFQHETQTWECVSCRACLGSTLWTSETTRGLAARLVGHDGMPVKSNPRVSLAFSSTDWLAMAAATAADNEPEPGSGSDGETEGQRLREPDRDRGGGGGGGGDADEEEVDAEDEGSRATHRSEEDLKTDAAGSDDDEAEERAVHALLMDDSVDHLPTTNNSRRGGRGPPSASSDQMARQTFQNFVRTRPDPDVPGVPESKHWIRDCMCLWGDVVAHAPTTRFSSEHEAKPRIYHPASVHAVIMEIVSQRRGCTRPQAEFYQDEAAGVSASSMTTSKRWIANQGVSLSVDPAVAALGLVRYFLTQWSLRLPAKAQLVAKPTMQRLLATAQTYVTAYYKHAGASAPLATPRPLMDMAFWLPASSTTGMEEDGDVDGKKESSSGGAAVGLGLDPGPGPEAKMPTVAVACMYAATVTTKLFRLHPEAPVMNRDFFAKETNCKSGRAINHCLARMQALGILPADEALYERKANPTRLGDNRMMMITVRSATANSSTGSTLGVGSSTNKNEEQDKRGEHANWMGELMMDDGDADTVMDIQG